VVRKVIERLLTVTGVLAASVALAAAVSPVAAVAAPAKPVKPSGVQVSGGALKQPLVVNAKDNADLCQALLDQVNWLADASPQTTAPQAKKLGTKYSVVVLVKNAPHQMYDVYPLATGGPRAFRPAKQPGGKKVAAGWFYARFTMSETLRLSGVPLPEKPDVLSGGIGGGERIDATEEQIPGPGLPEFLGELRQLVLLNGAVVLTIALGLAGISYLIRRRA
jgi:hypothetical protein